MKTCTDAAFLGAIREAPDDDTPRLVYADWLDEAGGDPAHAELIRLQCRLATHERVSVDEVRLPGRDKTRGLGADPFPPGYVRFGERTKLYRREKQLLARNYRRWASLGPPGNTFEVVLGRRWSFSGAPACRFVRGFLEDVAVRLLSWLNLGHEICDSHPVRRVDLRGEFHLDRWVDFGRRGQDNPPWPVMHRLVAAGEPADVSRPWHDSGESSGGWFRDRVAGTDHDRSVAALLRREWPSVGRWYTGPYEGEYVWYNGGNRPVPREAGLFIPSKNGAYRRWL